mmetsp:Transcript_24701/g.68893  ORF Transcript_24701/g.68893 Transcript_24701/m.68893 type:complete len:332 (+) Transcript_24701:96-1091(+)
MAGVGAEEIRRQRDDATMKRREQDASVAAQRRFAQKYIIDDKVVGEGTFGTVYRARCVRTGQAVAVKKIKTLDDEGVPSTAIREVAVLKNATHPNIVRLHDVDCTFGRLNLVFEFVDQNLKEFIREHDNCIEPATTRSFQKQMLLGINFCHSHRIVHRDLKPQNILIDKSNTLKIADFGMARAFSVPMPKYTHEVVTVWYRAPEILFGAEEYSLPIDMWSSGCILGEMAMGTALFRGDSEIDTMFQIFRKLGTPTSAEWPGLDMLPDFKPSFPQWRRQPWAEVHNIAKQLGPDGVELLDELLKYDPRKRMSAKQALRTAYLQPAEAASVAE